MKAKSILSQAPDKIKSKEEKMKKISKKLQDLRKIVSVGLFFDQETVWAAHKVGLCRRGFGGLFRALEDKKSVSLAGGVSI